MNTPTKQQIANGCRHFNGIQNETCEAEIAYLQFLNENYPQFPCIARPDGTFSGACPAFAWKSENEIASKEKAIREAVEKHIQMLADNLCPECGSPIEHKRQVGRCVYAAPCGHRLYQAWSE